ncbi:MAG: hypothetical protein P4K94_06060 [Terracidiphilus sp.]|jgi:hypothetical protein|nr:hypothetical protein [Terracidiphilus sp.]
MVKEHNPGFAAGIAQRSRREQIAWALKGAPKRKKDLRLDAIGALAEGRKLRDRITELMKREMLNPEDAMVLCIFAEPDLTAALGDGFHIPVKSEGTLAEIKAIEHYADKLPIGFLVFVTDRADPRKPFYGHTRPLIVEDPRGPLLNELLLHSYTKRLRVI